MYVITDFRPAETDTVMRASQRTPLSRAAPAHSHNSGGTMMRHVLVAAAIAAGLVALWMALLPLVA